MTTAISSFLFLKDLIVCKQRIRIYRGRLGPSATIVFGALAAESNPK